MNSHVCVCTVVVLLFRYISACRTNYAIAIKLSPINAKFAAYDSRIAIVFVSNLEKRKMFYLTIKFLLLDDVK